MQWERDAVHILQDTGWALGLVWMGKDNLVHTGVWATDSPPNSESQTTLHRSTTCQYWAV